MKSDVSDDRNNKLSRTRTLESNEGSLTTSQCKAWPGLHTYAKMRARLIRCRQNFHVLSHSGLAATCVHIFATNVTGPLYYY
ncbi:hypothetical protein BKA82DRAFT_1001060 [Pisolithus tinctorius]|uniref:Uncharacterized protein n=1 Tax=Pisolithus tinctorius Marx 270 TaxID=870435 RepID=A0A0C3P891_PISTI|nr:hypothetical protein BKA82DRAFT_1001060 [Pisolithus tinctorius]KIO03891.1 hypothetical protein M404DRAFT_1001060 [Pisolithus tinctorius Marx 270]